MQSAAVEASPTSASASAALPPPAKRRNVRKGTHSCWECKRRKTRCTFDDVSDRICIACKRRGCTCISQEYPIELSKATQPETPNKDLFTRIGKLVVQIITDGTVEPGSLGDYDVRVQNSDQDHRDPAVTTSSFAPIRDTPGGTNNPQSSFDGTIRHLPPSEFPHATPERRDMLQETSTQAPAHQMLNSGPLSPQDEIIISQFVGRLPIFATRMMVLPHTQLDFGGCEIPERTPDTHDTRAHPVLIARKMVTLAVHLQTIQPGCGVLADRLSGPPATTMMNLVKAATDMLDSQHEPSGSVEELEFLLLKGVFLANRGDLRHSWRVFRRLIADAQLVGIHHPYQDDAIFLDPKNNLDTCFLWYRIIYTERLLCLLLGLPQASSDRTMGAEAALLADQNSMSRLERMHCNIASMLIDRNETSPSRIAEEDTRVIDLEIQRAAKLMPSRWWIVPNLSDVSDDIQRFWATIKLTNQLFHHFLLIQLHLPYLLRPSPSSETNYSKIVCVNSCREVLTRFIAFWSVGSAVYSFRAVNFFALSALTVLLLAHIDEHQTHRGGSCLAHQRPSDRALAEQVMDTMDKESRCCRDMLSKEGTDVVSRLSDIEEEAWKNCEAAGKQATGGYSLRLHIPSLGTLSISNVGIAKEALIRGKASSIKPPRAPQQQRDDGTTFNNQYPTPGEKSSTTHGCRSRHIDNEQAHQPSLDSPTPFTGMLPEDAQSQTISPVLLFSEHEQALRGVDLMFFESFPWDTETFPGPSGASSFTVSDIYAQNKH